MSVITKQFFLKFYSAKTFFLLIVFVFGMLLMPSAAMAFGLLPSAQDIQMEAEDLQSTNIKIQNTGEFETEFEVRFFKVEIGEGLSDLFFSEMVTDEQVFLSAPAQFFAVTGQSEIEVPITIKSRPGTTPGSYFFAVSVSEQTSAQAEIVARPALVSLIFVTVEGEMKEGAQWKTFSTDKNVYLNSTVILNSTVANSGERIVQPSGTISIESWTGKQVAELSFNQEGFRTPGGHLRTYEAEYLAPFWSMGRYRATLSVQPWGSAPLNVQSTTFILIPTKLIIGLGIIGLAFQVVFLKKKQVKYGI